MNSSKTRPNHLYLTGYRGCGKSTIAKELAARLNFPLIDLDELIELEAGMTIAKIFEAESEAGFRDRESVSLQQVAAGTRSVISLGGGAILRPNNREIIAQSGWCVWLDASPETIADRLSTDATTGQRRPSLTGLPVVEEIETVMRTREPLYRDSSHLRIDTTDRSIVQIASEIIDVWCATQG